MKRVLLLIKGLGRGGAEQLLAATTRWVDHGRFAYEVGYLLPRKDALVGEIEAAGVPVRCLGPSRSSWVRRLRRLVDERGVDLVHAHSPVPAVGARLALAGRVRLVYTEHNVWERYRRPTYWGNALTFGRNDHVFAVSDHVRASIHYPRALASLRMPPVETLYHGLEPDAEKAWSPPRGIREELGIPDGTPLVGTVGSLTLKKDHETLLRAAALLGEQSPGLRVVIVGQGPLAPRLRRLIGELGLERTVVLAGYRPDAPRVTAALDVFVLPSRYEGLPISLLEAMALGRPVVATRAGGTSEVLRDGVEGVLVPPGDPVALADALRSLLADQKRRRDLGTAAAERAGDFDIRPAVRRQEDVYEELLA
jgi:glycosyltransferase involved in cell wall biosynthesis